MYLSFYTQSYFVNFQFVTKSGIYAFSIHILKICGKFEARQFNSLRGILHTDFGNMISIKNAFEVSGKIYIYICIYFGTNIFFNIILYLCNKYDESRCIAECFQKKFLDIAYFLECSMIKDFI